MTMGAGCQVLSFNSKVNEGNERKHKDVNYSTLILLLFKVYRASLVPNLYVIILSLDTSPSAVNCQSTSKCGIMTLRRSLASFELAS